MQWYSYTRAEVLDEYAVSFFTLLNEGYRLMYGDALLAAHIGDLPTMKAEDRKKFYREIEWASQHPSDILKPLGQGDSPAKIKKALSGR